MRSLRLLLAILAVLAGVGTPAFADQQLELLGVGGPHGAGASYSLSAVALNPISYVQSTQLGTTDTPYGVLSFWMRGGSGSLTYATGDNYGLYAKDILTNGCTTGTTCSTFGSETTAGLNIVDDNAGGGNGTVRANFNDSTTGTNHSVETLSPTSFMQPYHGVWHHFLYAFDFRTSALVAWYFDGVQQTLTVNPQGTVSYPLNVNIMNNANGFTMGGSKLNGPSNVDLAQVLLDTQTPIICTSTSSITVGGTSHACPGGSGTIPPDIVAKFYSGGPVDYGSNGANPLGYQPTVYHNGDPSTFLTENGATTATWSLAASTLNQTPVQTPAIYSATSAPNSTPAAAYARWVASASTNSTTPHPAWAALTSSTSTTFTLTNQGFPISAGDTLVAACQISEAGSNVVRNPVLSGPAGWTWTPVTGMPYNLSTASDSLFQSGTLATATAPSGIASGSNLSVTLTYTAGATPRGLACEVLDYGPTTSVTASASAGSTASLTHTAPAMTPTASVARLINVFFEFQTQSASPLTYSIPGTSNVRVMRPNSDGGNRPNIVMFDEALSAAGVSSGTRSTTTNISRSYESLSVLLQ